MSNDPAGENVGDQGQGDKGGASGEGAKTYTQAQLNAMLADNKRNLQRDLAAQREAHQTLRQQMEELLNGRPIDEFRSELETTAAKLRTAEEKALIEQNRYQRELKDAKEAAAANARKYEDAVIGRALTDAALSEGKAISVDAAGLLARELRSSAKVDENGNVFVEMEVEEEGIKTVKKLTPRQAVDVLETRQGWKPLFKSHVVGGTGGDGNGLAQKNGRPDVKQMTVEQYRKFRKENPGDYLQKLTS